jgi:hypothetical protein
VSAAALWKHSQTPISCKRLENAVAAYEQWGVRNRDERAKKQGELRKVNNIECLTEATRIVVIRRRLLFDAAMGHSHFALAQAAAGLRNAVQALEKVKQEGENPPDTTELDLLRDFAQSVG